jgi:hypothetical protein
VLGAHGSLVRGLTDERARRYRRGPLKWPGLVTPGRLWAGPRALSDFLACPATTLDRPSHSLLLRNLIAASVGQDQLVTTLINSI